MDSVFHVNPQLDIPIYQQLVDRVRTAVKQVTLADVQQLPTVQELAEPWALPTAPSSGRMMSWSIPAWWKRSRAGAPSSATSL